MTVRRIGVVGTGRLGKVLAGKLAPRYTVAAHDRDVRKAKQFCKQAGITFLYPEPLARWAELFLLCVPAAEVLPWILNPGSLADPGAVFVNLATDLPTHDLAADPRLAGRTVIGLKPIAQYVALERGLSGLFVTGTRDPQLKGTLAEMFAALGRVVTGDEGVVRAINRTATAAALRLCAGWAAALPEADAEAVESALKNVVVGTILDYPPDTDNAYTNRILGTLREARDAAGVGGVV
jgi:pyrroline-5-carboxylate reductase